MSVLNAALSLEALANILLENFDSPRQLTNDVDKLSTLGKFDIYLLSRGNQKFLDRGNFLVQQVSALISWRHGYVHPRTRDRKWNKLSEHSFEEAESPLHTVLNIPIAATDSGWTPDRAKHVVKFLFQFFTEYLLGTCAHRPLEMRNLLFNMKHSEDGSVQHYSYQPSRHGRIAIDEWGLDARFLCLWVSRSRSQGGMTVTYEPGYPEDIEVYRGPDRV